MAETIVVNVPAETEPVEIAEEIADEVEETSWQSALLETNQQIAGLTTAVQTALASLPSNESLQATLAQQNQVIQEQYRAMQETQANFLQLLQNISIPNPPLTETVAEAEPIAVVEPESVVEENPVHETRPKRFRAI